MIKSIVFISCSLICIFCSEKKIINSSIYLKENNFTSEDTEMILRCDGLYNTYDTSKLRCSLQINERYVIYKPLIILNSHNLKHSTPGGSLDSNNLTFEFYANLINFTKLVGNYYINNDTLRAKTPVYLYAPGMRLKLYECNYIGIIKNRDTITDWHIVPPYPKANPKFNENFHDLLEPHTLYFIKSTALSKLDSLYQIRLKVEKK
jgi:hypothetical protein